MSEPKILPSAFQPLIDALVEAAYGGPVTTEPRAFLDWLQEEDWDYLVKNEDDFALKLDYVASLNFSDEEMEGSIDYEPVEIVTDAVRVAHARRVIERITSEYEGYECPSFHTYPIESTDGRTAVIGVTVEIHGQAGPVIVWQGGFDNAEQFLQHLRDEGFLLFSEMAMLADAAILRLWSR